MESQSSQINVEMVLILGTSGMLLLVTAIVLFIYLYQRKLIKRKIEYQQIEDLLKGQELKSAYAILAAQEKAYKHVAEELHDDLGSMLVTLNMLSDTLPTTTDPEILKSVAVKIGEVANEASEATRQISHSLYSGVLKHFGLETALIELTDTLNDTHTISVERDIEISSEVNSEISLQVYRMIQELVNNTLKHARASHINLDVSDGGDFLSVIFEDDGVGYDTTSMEKQGLGLQNLKTRVEKLEGQITMQSQSGKGSTTIIEIPI